MELLQTLIPGKVAHIEKDQPDYPTDLSNLKPADLKFEKPELAPGAPKVDISFEPQDGEYIVFHLTPGFTFTESQKGQLSVLALMHNKETKNVDLDKVEFQYKENNQTIT